MSDLVKEVNGDKIDLFITEDRGVVFTASLRVQKVPTSNEYSWYEQLFLEKEDMSYASFITLIKAATAKVDVTPILSEIIEKVGLTKFRGYTIFFMRKEVRLWLDNDYNLRIIYEDDKNFNRRDLENVCGNLIAWNDLM